MQRGIWLRQRTQILQQSSLSLSLCREPGRSPQFGQPASLMFRSCNQSLNDAKSPQMLVAVDPSTETSMSFLKPGSPQINLSYHVLTEHGSSLAPSIANLATEPQLRLIGSLPTNIYFGFRLSSAYPPYLTGKGGGGSGDPQFHLPSFFHKRENGNANGVPIGHFRRPIPFLRWCGCRRSASKVPRASRASFLAGISPFSRSSRTRSSTRLSRSTASGGAATSHMRMLAKSKGPLGNHG